MDNLISEIVDICKLPLDETINKFKIIQIGNGVIYVSNYIKLLDYTLDKIALKVKDGVLEIVGENMVIKQINKKEILISGVIYNCGQGVKNAK